MNDHMNQLLNINNIHEPLNHSLNTKNPKNNVIFKTIFLGICYFCLFTAYNLSQGYLTTIFKDQGYIFIALIYFPYAFMSLFSAWIGKRIGLKAVLMMGSFTYVIWTLVITTSVYELIVTVALLNGLGAGLLWVHQGIWLSVLIKSDLSNRSENAHSQNRDNSDGVTSSELATRWSVAPAATSSELATRWSVAPAATSRDGTLTGLFFGIYNFSGIVGNIVIMILVRYYDLILILRIMSGFALLTWGFFWLIPYPKWNSWKIFWNKVQQEDKQSSGLITDKQSVHDGFVSAAQSDLDSELTEIDVIINSPTLNVDVMTTIPSFDEGDTVPSTYALGTSFNEVLPRTRSSFVATSPDSDYIDALSEHSFSENLPDDQQTQIKQSPSPRSFLSKEDSLRNHSRRLAQIWKSDGKLSHDTSILNTSDEPSLAFRDIASVQKTTSCSKISKFPFLIPIMIQIAFLNILCYGIVSSLAGQSIAPDNYDTAFVIAGTFLLNSIFSVIFSMSWGYIYDLLGWAFVLFIIEVLLLAELIFMIVNLTHNKDIASNLILSHYYVWWIIGLVAGAVDTGFNVLLNASISFTFDKQAAPYVFSWYRFIYCFSCAIFSICNYLIEPVTIMYCILAWSLITCTSLTIFKLLTKS